jgi:hypothetical protein
MSGKLKPYPRHYGAVAIEKGFITPKQLLEGLKKQVMDEFSSGRHRLIGAILCELEYITLEQNDEVIDALA